MDTNAFNSDRSKAIAFCISKINQDSSVQLKALRKEFKNNDKNNKCLQDISYFTDIDHATEQLQNINRINTLMKRASSVIDQYIRSVQYNYASQKEESLPKNIFIVKIDKSVLHLPPMTFNRQLSIRHIILDKETALNNIGNNCFENCYKLLSINIPNSTTTIGSYTFTNCEKLEYVSIPNRLQYLEQGVFMNCKSLPKVFDIPTNVLSIEKHAFCGCDSLVGVRILSPVININRNAFDNCVSLCNLQISRTHDVC